MSRLLAFITVLQAIEAAGRTLLLVGDVPAELRKKLPPKVSCTGRVDHAKVPHHLRRARFGLNLVPNAVPFQHQTSTKVLEYCAAGLKVVSNACPWVRYFIAQHKANFYLLSDNALSLATSFGEALQAYPYAVPDMRALEWSQILDALPLWKTILR
jgi:glycosyltransferase involved in cell wall biosynthesis